MTYDTFAAQYPQFFPTIEQAIIENQLAASTLLLDATVWGDFYDQAIGLDVAHNLALMQYARNSIEGAFEGTAGPVTGVSGGGLSTSFASPGIAGTHASENWYMKTIYGQLFLRLRANVCPLGDMAI